MKIKIPPMMKRTFSTIYPEWLKQLGCQCQKICNMTSFEIHKIEENSRFGLVAYGVYKGKESVLKILPPNVKKSQCELAFLTGETYSCMIPIMYMDENNYFYIMEKGIPLPPCSTYEERFQIVRPFFSAINNKSVPCKMELESYESKLFKRVYQLKGVPLIGEHLKNAQEFYSILKQSNSEVAIHADFRYSNILYLKSGLVAIDPLGLNGPKIFEYTKYIEDEIYNCKNFEDLQEILNSILGLFHSLNMECENLVIALYIDSVLRTSYSYLMNDAKDLIVKGINNADWLKEYLAIV